MDQITNQSGLQYQYKIDPGQSASAKTIQSNVLTTKLVTASLKMEKTVDKSYATVNDVLNYTVKLTNNGTILLTDVKFNDILPSGAEFVTGSVKIDNVSQPSYDVTTGFTVGDMILLASKTVTFQAKITSLPSPNTIINQATTTYNYLVTSLLTGNSTSNSVTTTVNVTNLSIVKSSDVSAVEIGDEITYTIVITNDGNINATGLAFTDVLVNSLQFNSGTVTINGAPEVSYNPNTGFNLPDLAPAAKNTVTFKATVVQAE